jgi:hypothetical protein
MRPQNQRTLALKKNANINNLQLLTHRQAMRLALLE